MVNLLYRLTFRVDTNRVYHYESTQYCKTYVEYIIVGDVDPTTNLPDLFYKYGWSQYGLTEEHYSGCRACDPSEDVDSRHCGFKCVGWELVPVDQFTMANPTDILTDEFVDKVTYERTKEWNQILKQREEKAERLRLRKKEEEDAIANIREKYASMQ